MALNFSICAAACWNPADNAPRYDNFPVPVSFVADENPPATKRPLPTKRRLSQLCKASLLCANLCCGDNNDAAAVPLVFASRRGEWTREIALLFDYARDNEVSQGGFSLSVHNAAASLFSISCGNKEPYTAIAAGETTFEAALLEATMQLARSDCGRALLVVGDERAPQEFRSVSTDPQVHALMLARGRDFSLSCENGNTGAALSAYDFFRFVELARLGGDHQLRGATMAISANG